MSATLEAQMNAVERIKFYIDEIEQEGTVDELAEKDIPTNWPEKGVIKSNNICLRYREGPLVLKGITVEVYSGEKIGVVGRTGSGKSSLMNALYRIHELSDGSLLIDDIDISRVPLPLLRSKLGIVPQDPVMFSATVRFNLDPFNQHSDAEVWSALEMVEMKDHVTSLPNKLLEEVAEGGENFSSGQRQLICIGRALLRNPRILILDEATASIDNETDAMIQVTIRKVFQKCTVLTIAHRLHTIIDSDRVIVLDNGILAEFDKPDILLGNNDGIFKSLWDKHSATHA
jgi:ABC-type multidrug transport system fused ATPase/permease subunit